MKKHLLLMIILALCLLCAFGCAEEDYSLPQGRDEDGSLRLLCGEELLGTVSAEQIASLPTKTKKVSYDSSSQGKVSGDFTGVLLADIIKLCDHKLLEEYDSVTAAGSDGYFAKLTMDEVRQLNNVYIMLQKDGEPLPIFKGTAEGSMRLIATNDKFGIRFTNYLVDLIFVKEEE